MDLTTSYFIYAIAAIGLTGVLARTLFRNGKVFLRDVFDDNEGMAEAVNHLLVVGFYMLNLGYAFLIFRTEETATSVEAAENLITKLGVLLLSLGIIHFVNIAVFWRLRRRNEAVFELPPIAATSYVAPPPPPPAPGTAVATA
ncbi:MAG: hypothetical protein DHS20C19_11450 [Acidimicrobiales bacterium]|nr:MAG: hypothetical protein DHS20C19_11450 [Acidimicrobiales bacterium]